MHDLQSKPQIRMMVLIVGQKETKKAIAILEARKMPIQFLFNGEGTASSEILEYLGLGISEKAILMSIVTKERAEEVLTALDRGLQLSKPNGGIAFTFPISGGSASVVKLLDAELRQRITEHLERSANQMIQESKNSLLLVVINQGYSEEVMAAARKAGAMGGTVVRARRLGTDEPMKKWGVTIQEEKEMIYILAHQSKKTAIMQSIGEQCGLHTEARGIVISIPVDAVAGINGDVALPRDI